jgi:hypothetical protein
MMQEQLQSAGRSVGHCPGTPKLQPEANCIACGPKHTHSIISTCIIPSHVFTALLALHKSVAAVWVLDANAVVVLEMNARRKLNRTPFWRRQVETPSQLRQETL